MNAEKLWLAIGEADGAAVAAAENFPKQKRRSLHILLAAAIILSLSVTAVAAVRYRAEIKSIWAGSDLSESAASEIESGTVPVEAEKSDEQYTAASRSRRERACLSTLTSVRRQSTRIWAL